MEGKVDVYYLEGGKNLQEFVQEWIDENSNVLYDILQEKAIELERR